ncbi:MAG: methyltransferase domain-containing protein [Actinomycetota bacterium]|nr:methyltransferase domain-containing protein [Actinomycetota bacterium]
MGAANTQTLRGIYAPMAPDYEEIWAPLLRPYGLRLLEMLPLERARRVLELGCGVGRLLPDIAERARDATVIGCDLVEDMLRRAPPTFPRAVVDGTQLPFADASFDAVVSAFCIFHFPDPPDAMRGVRRTMAPGGSIALAVWGTGQNFPAGDAWEEALDRLGVPPDPAAAELEDGRQLVDSTEKMRAALEDAGFEDVRSESAEWRVQWTLDGFVDWRLRLGPSRRRLGRLDPERRAAVIAEARAGVVELGASALVDLDEVVLASGRTSG